MSERTYCQRSLVLPLSLRLDEWELLELVATWRKSCLSSEISTTTNGATLRWTTAHPVKQPEIPNRRLRISKITGGEAIAEAYSN